jgi:CBS domain containing-hemolysin-like protein
MGGGLAVAAFLAAFLAASWAGFLVLAEEAPTLVRTPVGTTGEAARARVFPAIQIARLALLILAGVCAAAAVGWWHRPPIEATGTVLVSIGALYVLADGIPRALGVLAPRLTTAVAPIARRTMAPFVPLIGLMTAAERRVAATLPPVHPTSEAFGQGQRDMLLGLLSLRDMMVAEVMTPRLDIVALDARATFRDVVDLLKRSEHARIPVYHEDLDNIAGVLYAKDVTPAAAGIAGPPGNWHELVRPAQFVPESKSLAAQLRDFQRGPSHLAIVVDEFGGTSGLVTLEDILEEVVGEIYDEYDVDEEPAIEREGTDRFWVDGRVSIDDLAELLGTTFEEEDVTTVGGLIYAELGRVPRPGEELRIDDFRVVVEQVAKRRVRRVYFERLQDTSIVEAGRGGEG